MAEKLKVTKINSYIVEDGQGTIYRIIYEPVGKTVPGFSHKVVVVLDGKKIGQSWLSDDFRISAKTTQFFYYKVVLGKNT